MKIFLIFALLYAYLSAEIYQCDGIGNSKPEAQENAKQSAVALSSTYIKSEYKNLQLKISSFNNNQTQQTDLKKLI